MSAHILTSGYWPSYPVLDAQLPAELTQYQVKPMPLRSLHPRCGGATSTGEQEPGVASSPSFPFSGRSACLPCSETAG